MKPLTHEEYEDYKRIKALADDLAELLKCKPSEIIIRIIELKCQLNTANVVEE
jgi:hypothetical protein